MSKAFRAVKPRPWGTEQQVMTDAYEELGGLDKAAHIAGCSRSLLALYSDPDQNRPITLQIVEALVRGGANEPCHHFARLGGGYFVECMPSNAPTEILLADILTMSADAAALALESKENPALATRDMLQKAEWLVRRAVAFRNRVMADIEGQ